MTDVIIQTVRGVGLPGPNAVSGATTTPFTKLLKGNGSILTQIDELDLPISNLAQVAINARQPIFDPSQIDGYMFDVRHDRSVFTERTGAAATTESEDGDLVGTQKDIAGNVYLTAVADGERPRRTPYGLKYTGASTNWLRNTTTGIFASLSKFTLFVRCSAHNGIIMDSGAGILVQQANNVISIYIAGVTNRADTLAIASNISTIRVVFDGTQTGNDNRLKVYVDGTQASLTFTGTIEAATTSGLGIGIGRYWPSDAAAYFGFVPAVIAYETLLNDVEAGLVEGFLLTNYTGIATAGSRVRDDFLILPATANFSTNAVILYCHGASVDETYLTTANHTVVNSAMNAAGYVIAGSYSGSDAHWGNPASIERLKIFYDYLIATFSPTRVILWGESMGGCIALKALADSRFAPIKGAYLNFPACSLTAMNYGGFVAQLAAAYPSGFAGESPTDIAGSAYAGKRLRFTHSPSDTVVVKTTNTDAMRTIVSGQATESGLVTTTGEHGDISNYDATDMVDFFNRCV